jgi:Ca-activated chloride channel family protein
VHVTVTDPLNRFVTGIEQERFQIVEKGVRRQITGFSDVNSPITVAIVSETPLPVNSSDRVADELIQTPSVSDALRQIQASKNSRKALVVTNGGDLRAIPGNIQIVQTDSDNLSKRVVELRNQYLLQFESSDANASVEVILRQPQGLPPLRTNLR